MEEKEIEICIIAERKLFGDNQIENLEKLGQVIFYRKKNYAELLKNDNNKKIIVYDPDYGGWNFRDTILNESKNIMAIFLGTTDKSYVNLELCEKLNIPVYNIPKYAGDSVAEYLVMYMFSCAKKLPLQLKNKNKQEFDDIFIQMQLKNKKVGIVGLGNIGNKIADICDGIGMKICYWNRKIKQSNYEYISLKTLFKTCDVIFLCLQINEETKKIITDDLLESMKTNTIFISCTGKQLFNYSIIEKRIQNNELFGFATEEPDIALNKYDGNVMVTSEYAWFTEDAAKLRISKWYEKIIDYLCNIYGYSTSKFISTNELKTRKNVICNIRRAKKEDLKSIAKLYVEQSWFGEDNSVKKMKDNYDENSKDLIILVAEYKGKVVGTITINITKSLAFNCMKYITFDYLVVKKEYRRKKVGTQLMEAMYRIAENENLESIWGVASYGRKKASEFFLNVGLDDPVLGFRKIYIDESVVI